MFVLREELLVAFGQICGVKIDGTRKSDQANREGCEDLVRIVFHDVESSWWFGIEIGCQITGAGSVSDRHRRTRPGSDKT